MTRLAFTKMHGCGNDFVMIDGRGGIAAPSSVPRLASVLCDRRRGIGADGLVLLKEGPAGTDFEMVYINASGMPGEMCGNGARCAARFAHDVGIVGERAIFATGGGTVKAEIRPSDVVIDIDPPRELKLDMDLVIGSRPTKVHFASVGVPHAVVMTEDVRSHPVESEGPALRHHQAFARGCNANFVSLVPNGIAMRTFERGVEAETLACGTGSVACSAVVYLLGLGGRHTIVHTHGGDRLEVDLEVEGDRFVGATLAGPTETVARGELDVGYLLSHRLA